MWSALSILPPRRHAFNVSQMMFAMLTKGELSQYFSDLVILGLIVATLSHDLGKYRRCHLLFSIPFYPDHRGTNNAFQSRIGNGLAVLYGSSTLEHHHFNQCMLLLSSPGNNILSGLSDTQYKKVIGVVEHAILATDLAVYFKKKSDFERVVGEHIANEAFHDTASARRITWRDNQYANQLLRGMMMTACDLSAVCKPWQLQRQIALIVYQEFFDQVGVWG